MRRGQRKGRWWLLIVLLLTLAGTLFLRAARSEPSATTWPEQLVPTESSTPPEPTMGESPSPSPRPTLTSTAESTPVQAPDAPKGYTARTYQLVSDIIYLYRYQPADRAEQVNARLSALREADPALGGTWTDIVAYWDFANTEMKPQYDVPPEGLPEDDSLCFVVLGYQLLYDGDMAPELLGRCETALSCLHRYPKACVAVTGGGTAPGDRGATEAGVMADWLIAQGIDPARIIVEDASLTTDQNARNTCTILMRDYPQIRSLVIISSDYHLRLGCLMFEEAALLNAYEHGEKPFTVVGNAAYATNGDWALWDQSHQASYVWLLADPEY